MKEDYIEKILIVNRAGIPPYRMEYFKAIKIVNL
jgi:hypothetical protein